MLMGGAGDILCLKWGGGGGGPERVVFMSFAIAPFYYPREGETFDNIKLESSRWACS